MEALAIADADVSGYGREDDSSAQHMVGDTAKQSSDTDQDNRFQKAVAAWRGSFPPSLRRDGTNLSQELDWLP